MSKRPLPANWPWIRKDVFERDDWKCVNCGSRHRIECDHIIPRDRDGESDWDNLQTLCRKCHMLKTAEETGNRQHPGMSYWADYVHSSPARKRRMLQEAKKNA